ncbi:unnamed protein product [Mytilus coruscus]|uniref:Uncharacterized protein n=1 Tax=Mytilus coruscus TaxID=42192 RepID=A0A6J8A2C2_MYTCO|nr:unnamed protein product [Mytilus coruscus]
MATRKSKRQTKRTMHYEQPSVDANEDPSTWSKTKLIQELKGIDIEVPADLSKPITLQLYNSNIKSKRKEATVIENETEECPQSHTVIADSIEVNLPGKPDIRLNRTLTIQEFIKAFAKYKRIMSKAYPERRAELDAYEEDIIDISNFYGSKYYDYHKMFSSKASTLLREHPVKVDWSKRDRDLFTLVAAGIQINVCELCHMCNHTTDFCLLQLRNKINLQEVYSFRNDDRSDKYGQPKYFQDG